MLIRYWVSLIINGNKMMANDNYYKFPLAPMGVLAPGSAHARPSARPPIDTNGNFSAHMSERGGKKNCVRPKSYFLCDFKPHAKFQNPTITLSGRKVTRHKERKRENKTPLIVDT